MADDGSSPSTETVTYEEHCQNHGYPLSLVRGATSVPKGAGNCPLFEFCMIGSGCAAFAKCLGSGQDVEHRRLPGHLVIRMVWLTRAFLFSILGASSEPSRENAFDDSVLDFDVSLLQPSASSSSSFSGEPALFVPWRDSLQVRISEIENRLGVFYVSVRWICPSQVVESMTLACQEIFYMSVFHDSFAVARVLYSISFIIYWFLIVLAYLFQACRGARGTFRDFPQVCSWSGFCFCRLKLFNRGNSIEPGDKWPGKTEVGAGTAKFVGAGML